MNRKMLGVVLGAGIIASALGVVFVTGIIGPSTQGKSKPSPTMSGYTFSNNNQLSISLTSSQTGTITLAKVCNVANSCYSEAISFSYPGKLDLNLNNMVGATFVFQYYSNYTVVLTDSTGNHNYQTHYADPYGPVMSSSSFSNNTAVVLCFHANGTYTQCGTDACGSGTLAKAQVCYSSSCYSQTIIFSYPGILSLNLNSMASSGTAFTFTSGSTYTIVLTDPDRASYSWQITK